jgi:hypothetical protein
MRAPVSAASERLGLVRVALTNLVGANIRQPYDHRKEARSWERELTMLMGVATERSQLIDSLSEATSERRELLRARGLKVEAANEQALSDLGDAPLLPALLQRKGSRGPITDFFSPPAEWQIRRIHELHEHIQRLRGYCDEQLQAIELLNAEASRLLELIDSSPTTTLDG